MVCDVCECGLVMVDWRALRRSKTELFDVAGRKGRGLALKGRAFLQSLPCSSPSTVSLPLPILIHTCHYTQVSSQGTDIRRCCAIQQHICCATWEPHQCPTVRRHRRSAQLLARCTKKPPPIGLGSPWMNQRPDLDCAKTQPEAQAHVRASQSV